MGVRSDVAVLMKHRVFASMPDLAKKLLSECDEEHRDDEGVLFHFLQVKWYGGKDIDALNDALDKEEDEDWLIIEACHDYPCTEDYSTGDWVENPWNAFKQVSVSINIDPS